MASGPQLGTSCLGWLGVGETSSFHPTHFTHTSHTSSLASTWLCWALFGRHEDEGPATWEMLCPRPHIECGGPGLRHPHLTFTACTSHHMEGIQVSWWHSWIHPGYKELDTCLSTSCLQPASLIPLGSQPFLIFSFSSIARPRHQPVSLTK